MKKTVPLKVVNSLVALLFLVLALTGIGSSVLPIEYGEVHQYAGYAFVVFALFHVALNWAWIRANVLKPKKKP